MSAQVISADAFARASTSVALKDLLRTQLARAEDLRLLRQVATGQVQLPAASLPRLCRECALREEFRAQREAQLLEQLRGAQLVSSDDSSSWQLSDELLALQQIQEEERRLYRSRQARSSSRGGVAAAPPASLGSASQARPPWRTSTTPMDGANTSSSSPYLDSPRSASSSARARAGQPTTSATDAAQRPAAPAAMPAAQSPFFSSMHSACPPAARASRSAAATTARSPAASPAGAAGRAASRSPQTATSYELQRMQGTLMQDLRRAVASDGQPAAYAALVRSTAEQQQHLQECLAQLQNDSGPLQAKDDGLSHVPDVNAPDGGLPHVQGGSGLQEAPDEGMAAAPNMQQDEHPAVGQQQQQHQQQQEQEQEHERQHELDGEEVQRQRRRERQEAAVERLRVVWAALRIQRAYRRHARLKRSSASFAVAGDGGLEEQRASCSGARAEQAAAVIQAAVRGWICRRGDCLWWRRACSGMCARRAAKRMWQRQRELVASTADLQSRLVALVEQGETAEEAARQFLIRESEAFETAWEGWCAPLLAQAEAQPLPRGWLPHADLSISKDGKPLFLNARTGEVHVSHPAVLELRAHLGQQRQRAEARMAAQQEAVAQELQELLDDNRKRQWGLMEEMRAAMGVTCGL